jgi:uncharacterized phage protein (TIGR02218 family)
VRNADQSMVAFLMSKEPFYMADLFTITAPTWGQQLNLTSFDHDITWGTQTWKAQGPLLTRSTWSIKNTIDVSTLQVNLNSSGTDYEPGNIKKFIHSGMLDSSTIKLQRAVMPTPGDTSLGLIDIWDGVGGKITGGARGVQITWSSRNVMMLQQMPKNRYKVTCLWTLYSAGCTMHAESFTYDAVVLAVDGTRIEWQADPTPGLASHFAGGYATFTEGPAKGQRRGIDWGIDLGINLTTALYIQPNPGDAFKVTFGCDKTRGPNGCGFFNNLQNFRGFPFIPPATFAI